jgi:uncharacterized membrane protein YkvA (DUF1232 family)
MTDENAQRRPYGSFDPAGVLDPSRALVPTTVQVNEVEVKRGFWPKMRKVAARVPFAKEALSVYFTARDPETPWKTKGVMMAGLAYFVLPTDAIPDVIAGLGFTDDAAVLMTLITVMGGAIKPRHKAAASDALQRLKADED